MFHEKSDEERVGLGEPTQTTNEKARFDPTDQ